MAEKHFWTFFFLFLNKSRRKWPNSCGISAEKRHTGILHSSLVTEKVPRDIMASATPLYPRLHLPLRLQWWRKVLYQKYLPGPDIQVSPISFLSSPSLPDTQSFFFFIQHSRLYLLCQLIVGGTSWTQDGCIMNMHAIEIQPCCCLEALYASSNVRLHNFKRGDRGTCPMLYEKTMVQFMRNRSGNSAKGEKGIAGILKWSRFTYHANFILTIKHLRKHALKKADSRFFFKDFKIHSNPSKEC